VEVGTKEIQVWSEKDSAYVTETEPIYQEVFVTVTNYEQFRQADLPFTMELIPNGREKPIAEEAKNVFYNWYNSFGEIDGDNRAVDSSCSPVAGIESSFPTDNYMLRQLGIRSRLVTQQFLAKHLESYVINDVRNKKLRNILR